MNSIRSIMIESIKWGTLAALAMMPFGFAFRFAGLRVGHYGPKFAALFIDNPGPPFLFAQHIILGWISALPLVALLWYWSGPAKPVLFGVIYGMAYYLIVNSLALPLYFGDALPWQLGIATVIPSLVVHIVFGATLGYFCRNLAGRFHRNTLP